MKQYFIIFCLTIGLFSCSSNIKKDEITEKDKLAVRQQISQQYSFPLSFDEQDELARQFAEICCIPAVNSLLLAPEQYNYQCHSLFNVDNEDEYVMLETIMNESGNCHFEEIVAQLCTENYLNFNVYIPHYTDYFNTIVNNEPIYVVNALYQDALQPIVVESIENQTYEYKVTYIVQDGEVIETDMWINEEFCENNIVYFVSFRDEIVEWNHFAKGTQSVSDWLISYTVEYQGFGCVTSDDLLYYDDFVPGKIVIPILHGKKTFRQPCNEKYDKFCKLGKPETLVHNLNMFEEIDFDPYNTSWLAIDEDNTTQYIPIISNPNQLNLEGHDFYVNDTILELDNGIRLYIPPHISTFDSDRNAQCIKIIIL